jgi:hypothetical protein
MEDRFEVFPDPLNNWIVWDTQKDAIAETDNQVLEFLSEDRARELCAVLNKNPASAYKVSHGSPEAYAILDPLEAIVASELASASLLASLVPALVNGGALSWRGASEIYENALLAIEKRQGGDAGRRRICEAAREIIRSEKN